MQIMPDDEKKLYDSLLSRFHFSTGIYQDYFNKIIKASIVNLINVEGLHIDPKEGADELILERFESAWRTPGNPKFELTLRDENNAPAKLIYYFPESPNADGHVFLSQPEKKKITEFTQFKKRDESIPAVKGRNGTGQIQDYYVINFGAKVKTIFSIDEGTIINEVDIVNTLKEIEYPKASVGESVSTIRFYGSLGADDYDFENPFKKIRPDEPETRAISTVAKIIKGLRKEYENILPNIYHFTDIKEEYEIPGFRMNEKVYRNLDYVRNVLEANDALIKKVVKQSSKKEETPSITEIAFTTNSRKGTPLIQREEAEVVVQKPEIQTLSTPETPIKVDETKRPELLNPEVENLSFMTLANKMKNYFKFMPSMAGRNSEIIGELIINILKKEGLHFKSTGNLLKSFVDSDISSEGFELIDQDGKLYRIIAGDSSKLITLIGEDKIINIKSGYYLDEKAKTGFGEDTKVEGFEITTIGVQEGGVYKNQNNIVFNWQTTNKGQRNKFFPKPVEIEYYSKDMLSALGVISEDVIKQALFQIRYCADDNDPFMDLHKYGPVYGEIEKSELKLDRKEYVSGLNGCPADDKEFCALYIGQNIESNYLFIEEFLNHHHVINR